jgi:hypothetical protein
MRKIWTIGLLLAVATPVVAETPRQKNAFEQKRTNLESQRQREKSVKRQQSIRSPHCEGTVGSNTFPACF